MSLRLLVAGILAAGSLSAAPLPAGRFVDIDATNTAAVAGTPSPFYTTNVADTGFTAGSLWRLRSGFGFDAAANRDILEKDANGGVGDAAALVTTVTGLVPNQSYGVYVAYLSVASENWQVKAGLAPGSLTLFTPSLPVGRVTSYGLSTEAGSNRTQYLGYVGNAVAAADGTLRLYSDDGDGTATNWSTRSWLEGFFLGAPYVPPPLPGNATAIAPDGAWTWFNDERAIVHRGSIYSGYVKAGGQYGVTRYNLSTGEASHMVLSTSTSQQQDDHNNPSLTVLPDGRLLALYSKHIAAPAFYQRTSLVAEPTLSTDWSSELVRSVPANNTYANTYRLTGEANAIYNFSRCINFNPTLTISTDLGVTWGTSRQLIGTGTGSTRPYPRYVSNDTDRVDFIYTDGHPRDVNNSVYHLYYKSGGLYKTDGTLVDLLQNIPLDHDGGERGNVLYQYSAAAWGPTDGPDQWIPTGRGWTWDIHYGADGNPVALFQVQRDDPTNTSWANDRIFYYYARWNGSQWQRKFIAHGGRPIYSAEDDYGGGMALDPQDPRVVYFSSNAANPFNLTDINNVPLRTNSRYELWRGFTADGGLTFTWTQLTTDSATDNFRPIVPKNHGRTECLLWFTGTYNTYTSYSTQVVGRLGVPAAGFSDWATGAGLGSGATAEGDDDGDGVPNLVEYALGGSPASSSSSPGLQVSPTLCSFPIDRSRLDVEVELQRSQDLVTWQRVALIRGAGLPAETAAGATATVPAMTGNVSVDLSGLALGAREFFRLQAVTVR